MIALIVVHCRIIASWQLLTLVLGLIKLVQRRDYRKACEWAKEKSSHANKKQLPIAMVVYRLMLFMYWG